jgi:hypothetical protein
LGKFLVEIAQDFRPNAEGRQPTTAAISVKQQSIPAATGWASLSKRFSAGMVISASKLLAGISEAVVCAPAA